MTSNDTMLLVDGTNIVMFAAFGGKNLPGIAASSALTAIELAASKVNAKRIVIALDSAVPTFRKALAPDYKAGRSVDTQPYVNELRARCRLRHWTTVAVDGFEADDILATLAHALPTSCVIFTNDSDALACINERVTVLRPVKIRESVLWDGEKVEAKYGVRPDQLSDYKALVGEPGDNIAGIAGVGPKKAAAMLQRGLSDEERRAIAPGLGLTTLRRNVPVAMRELNLIDECTCPMFLRGFDRGGDPEYVTAHILGRCRGSRS